MLPLFVFGVENLLLFLGKTVCLFHYEQEEESTSEAEAGEEVECSLLAKPVQEEL